MPVYTLKPEIIKKLRETIPNRYDKYCCNSTFDSEWDKEVTKINELADIMSVPFWDDDEEEAFKEFPYEFTPAFTGKSLPIIVEMKEEFFETKHLPVIGTWIPWEDLNKYYINKEKYQVVYATKYTTIKGYYVDDCWCADKTTHFMVIPRLKEE